MNMRILLLLFGMAVLFTALRARDAAASEKNVYPVDRPPDSVSEGAARAMLAGGCFWCMESDFEKLDGVFGVVSGYTGGRTESPTYRQVSGGGTGHYEAVIVEFDPDVLSYRDILDHFWRNVDPLDAGGQFCDKGPQYRSAIFWLDEVQKEEAEASLRELEESGRLTGRIVTPVLPPAVFWTAEDYHQDYYRKNPVRYRFYRFGCGRDSRLDALWGEENNH